MLQLPFEILELIFNHLKTKDLLQCQLTNKQCYEASVELLYSNLEIETSEKFRKYTRTISKSLRLGSYLKTLNTHRLFEKKPVAGVRRDEHGFLKAVVLQCPNLLEIKSYEPDPQFWYLLSAASRKHHLSRLQCLPDPVSDNLDPYINTALHFKASLTKLRIIDNIELYGLNLCRLNAYNLLSTEISEFKYLKSLELKYRSDKQLGCFDPLIEDCPRLQELIITLSSPESQQRLITESSMKSIHPRPGLRTLVCNWEIIDNESQLRYIMHKFPNLQCLTVNSYINYRHTGAYYCSSDTIIEFLRHVINIPKFDVEFKLENEHVVNVWSKLVDMKEIYRDVNIGYYDSDIPTSNKLTLGIDKRRLLVRFPLHNDDTELPHINFFSEATATAVAGSSSSSNILIRSLTINLDNFTYLAMVRLSNIYSTFTGINWIFELVQLYCPFLEELAFPLPNDINLSSELDMVQTHVKKLTVTEIPDIMNTLLFLKLTSRYLPNIRQLHLGYYLAKRYKPFPIIVNMTHSRLDLLTWRNEYPKFRIRKKFEVYIKLKTEKDTKFYMGTKTSLSLINEDQYEEAVAKFLVLCFDITCQSLIEFRISTTSLPTRTLTWIF